MILQRPGLSSNIIDFTPRYVHWRFNGALAHNTEREAPKKIVSNCSCGVSLAELSCLLWIDLKLFSDGGYGK